MNIDHVQFYVNDAIAWQDWFVSVWGFQSIAQASYPTHLTTVVQLADIRLVFSSPTHEKSAIAQYLRHHPPGVVDLAFRVPCLKTAVHRALHYGATLLHPLRVQETPTGTMQWVQMQGWGNLWHTLVQVQENRAQADRVQENLAQGSDRLPLLSIDHAVLNVPEGQLTEAIAWYERVFGFQQQQSFTIQTHHSGLCSQVLTHPDGTAQLPINEPTSPQSQIQEFLDANGGSGIQHLALQTSDIVAVMATLRRQGVAFLTIPDAYYDEMRRRLTKPLSSQTWRSLAQTQVLVDWQPHEPDALLLQAFTQPIFPEPTFFFELIQRRVQDGDRLCPPATGFGAGNFRALFEAMERSQLQRGTLTPSNSPSRHR